MTMFDTTPVKCVHGVLSPQEACPLCSTRAEPDGYDPGDDGDYPPPDEPLFDPYEDAGQSPTRGVPPVPVPASAPPNGDRDSRDTPRESLSLHLRDGAWLSAQHFPPVEWTVPNLIPEGLTLLVGAPKAGKSWLMLSVVVEVAHEGHLFGETLTARPVLHLALEDSDRRLRGRTQHLGYEQLPTEWHYLTRLPPSWTIPDIVAGWLDSLTARTTTPPLVVIDTLGKVRPGKRPGEGAYEYDYRVGGALKDLADAVPGMALVVVHHDRKANSADFVDDVSGTNGLAGSADTLLVVKRDRNTPDGVLLVTGRDVDEAAYAATFNAGRWELAGDDWQAAREQAALNLATVGKGDTAHRIVEWLAQHEGSRPVEVADALSLDHELVKKTCQRLYNDGRVDRDHGRYFLPAGRTS